MERHHNGIWPDEEWGKAVKVSKHWLSGKSAETDTVCNRMQRLSSSITGATLYSMVQWSAWPFVCHFILYSKHDFSRRMWRGVGNVIFSFFPLLCPSAFSCKAGEFLEMSAQECTQCAAGSYSLGSGIRFDQWGSMPPGFSSLATSQEINPHGDDRLTCNRCVNKMQGKLKAGL